MKEFEDYLDKVIEIRSRKLPQVSDDEVWNFASRLYISGNIQHQKFTKSQGKPTAYTGQRSPHTPATTKQLMLMTRLGIKTEFPISKELAASLIQKKIGGSNAKG